MARTRTHYCTAAHVAYLAHNSTLLVVLGDGEHAEPHGGRPRRGRSGAAGEQPPHSLRPGQPRRQPRRCGHTETGGLSPARVIVVLFSNRSLLVPQNISTTPVRRAADAGPVRRHRRGYPRRHVIRRHRRPCSRRLSEALHPLVRPLQAFDPKNPGAVSCFMDNWVGTNSVGMPVREKPVPSADALSLVLSKQWKGEGGSRFTVPQNVGGPGRLPLVREGHGRRWAPVSDPGLQGGVRGPGLQFGTPASVATR